MTRRLLPVPPRDPFDGGRLVVTRLENLETGTIIEGRFDLGWVGRLTREQLDFVGLLVKHRANVQRLAGDIGIAYNTARARLDEIVQAIGGSVSTRMRLPILPQLRASTRCWTALHRARSTPQGRSTNCGAGAPEATRAR